MAFIDEMSVAAIVGGKQRRNGFHNRHQRADAPDHSLRSFDLFPKRKVRNLPQDCRNVAVCENTLWKTLENFHV